MKDKLQIDLQHSLPHSDLPTASQFDNSRTERDLQEALLQSERAKFVARDAAIGIEMAPTHHYMQASERTLLPTHSQASRFGQVSTTVANRVSSQQLNLLGHDTDSLWNMQVLSPVTHWSDNSGPADVLGQLNEGTSVLVRAHVGPLLPLLSEQSGVHAGSGGSLNRPPCFQDPETLARIGTSARHSIDSFMDALDSNSPSVVLESERILYSMIAIDCELVRMKVERRIRQALTPLTVTGGLPTHPVTLARLTDLHKAAINSCEMQWLFTSCGLRRRIEEEFLLLAQGLGGPRGLLERLNREPQDMRTDCQVVLDDLAEEVASSPDDLIRCLDNFLKSTTIIDQVLLASLRHISRELKSESRGSRLNAAQTLMGEYSRKYSGRE